MSEATIENFSKSFSVSGKAANDTSVWIALKDDEKENGVEKLENILQKMILDFYLLNVYIDFYYTNEEIINTCNEKIYSKNTSHWEVRDILDPHDYPFEYFVYFSYGRGLKYSGNEIMY